jgi:hypothetical protein
MTKGVKNYKKQKKFESNLKKSKLWEISFFVSLFLLLIFIFLLIVFIFVIPYITITTSPDSY